MRSAVAAFEAHALGFASSIPRNSQGGSGHSRGKTWLAGAREMNRVTPMYSWSWLIHTGLAMPTDWQ